MRKDIRPTGRVIDRTRINERITFPEVRVVDEEGAHLSVMSRDSALAMARERGLDLVEISPDARPPVCKIMDYGRFKYEKKKKEKESKKKQKVITIKEIKLRPKTDTHDRQTKENHAREFLLRGDKVKFTLRFVGREMAHTERGIAVLGRLAEHLQDVSVIERSPLLEGRLMAMYLAPLPEGKRLARPKTAEAEGGAGPEAEAQGEPTGSGEEGIAPEGKPMAPANPAEAG